ncbi:hypothetical protein GCM10023084_72510 [Streptomyces lacrimifluminis]|uniref:Polyprenyl synthetase n=1 Tax=Streptomyces lacrimifluminis TaxID=1500077 RepID=A0A917P611_9ACTN|nr:hypothetical protein [Streptomyces lacrimifluminis]GGJ63269.1 hypothetical protein GCM10012282_70590 [Streptomyces lacrimifluminis]
MSRDQAAILHTLLGDPGLDEEGAGRLREVLLATGASREVEHMIHTRRAQALTILEQSPVPPAAAAALRRIARAATARTT